MFADLEQLSVGDKVRFQPYTSDVDAYEVTDFTCVNGKRIKATAKQCVEPSNTVTLEFWQYL